MIMKVQEKKKKQYYKHKKKDVVAQGKKMRRNFNDLYLNKMDRKYHTYCGRFSVGRYR